MYNVIYAIKLLKTFKTVFGIVTIQVVDLTSIIIRNVSSLAKEKNVKMIWNLLDMYLKATMELNATVAAKILLILGLGSGIVQVVAPITIKIAISFVKQNNIHLKVILNKYKKENASSNVEVMFNL